MLGMMFALFLTNASAAQGGTCIINNCECACISNNCSCVCDDPTTASPLVSCCSSGACLRTSKNNCGWLNKYG